jgi:hypothetical protein
VIRRAFEFVRGDPIAAVAAAVLVVGVVQLFAGALESGVTTDEPIQVDRTASWLEDGWYVPEELLRDGRPDPASSFSSPFVYGPAFAVLGHGANVLVGNEEPGEVSRSSAAYRVRHLVVALLAALSAAAVGVAVWRLVGSARFGLWAAAGLLAVPLWTGHGFFNPKDVPVAAGYTLVTAGLLLAFLETAGRRGEGEEEPRALPGGRPAIGVLLGAGVFLALGTRPAMWAPVGVSLATYAAIRVAQRRLGGLTIAMPADRAVAIGTLAGIAAIALAYPNVVSTPIDLLNDSVSGAADFPYRGFTLTAGELLSEEPPWWYLPTWLWASFPLMLGALALLGAVVGIRLLAAGLRERGWRGTIWSRPELGLLLVFQQAMLLPAVAVLGGATMYNGLRQHLYLVPALAILSGVGAHRLWEWAGAREPLMRRRRLTVALLGAALLVPMAEQTLLFPYNYAYVNPLAGVGGVEDRWETDYWFASGAEAISRVPEDAELLCSRFLLLPWQGDEEVQLEPCTEEQLAPFADRRGARVSERWRGDDTLWVVGRKRAANRPPEGCEEADSVTRWMRGETVTMAFVLRCDRRRVGGE